MNKKLNVIENASPPPIKSRSVILPLVGVAVFGFGLFWIGTHLAGGCLDAKDILAYCEVEVK